MSKNKFIALGLISFGLVLTGYMIAQAQTGEVKIERACSEGQFIRYTDCETGKAISRSALAPGKHRFGSISANGQSFKVLIQGGSGIYKVNVKLTGGNELYVADYPANGAAVQLTAEAKKNGWTSAGVEIFMPKDSNLNAEVAKVGQDKDIKYPIPELGNCKDKESCKSSCEKKENITACVSFAEKRGLISKEDAAQAKRFAAMGDGPGGCKDKNSCESYCNDISRINECVGFAEKNNLISGEELQQAKKVQAALAKGAQLPGGCKNKGECDKFCNSSDHMEECISFAEAAGFIPPAELEDAKKVLVAIKNGAKAPPCRGKKECDTYCAIDSNFKECINFAEAAGFVSKEDAEMARKTGGKGPGNCKGKEECDKFCQVEGNFSSCVDFAVDKGLMSKEDAEMARKTGGKGPGGCKSKDECDSFCKDPANQEGCFGFAKEHGLIPPEQLKQAEEGMSKAREAMAGAPPEVLDCIRSKIGSAAVDKIQAGGMAGGPEMGQVMQNCFETIMPKLMGGGAEGGPSPEEIQKMMEGRTAPPSKEEIEQIKEKYIPKGVPIPEGIRDKIKNMDAPPSQDQIQSMIKEQIEQETKKQTPQGGGPPTGGYGPSGDYGPPKNIPSGFGPPAGIPSGPPAGF